MKKALLALPELVMESLQQHQGPSDVHSNMELGTKELTELGRTGDPVGVGGMLATPGQPS